MAVAVISSSLRAQATQFEMVALPASLTNGVNIIDVGDIDADGDLDFVVFDWFVGMRLLLNNGLAGFVSVALPNVGPAFGTASVPVLVDIDGDADLDVFVSEQFNSRLFRNDGGGAWTDLSAGLGPLLHVSRAHVADFDGDGDQDIACTGVALIGARNQMLVNGGGGVFTSVEPFPGFFASSIDAADIDGDGDLDLAIPEGSPRLWRNDGGMVFTDITATHLPVLPTTPALCAFGDVDGDGDVDLFVGGSPNGMDRVLLNDGTGSFTELLGAAPLGLGSTQSVELRDLDGDGDVDLIRGTIFHRLTIARNDGSGMFSDEPNAYPPSTPGVRYVRVGDFDGDLDLDVLAQEFGVVPRLFINQHRHLRQNAPPQIGQPWTVAIISQPGYASAARPVQLGIALDHLQQPLPLPLAGALWLDPAAPLLLLGSVLPAGASSLPFVLMVPSMPALVGLELHAQALLQEVTGPLGLRLTPMLSTTIQ